MYAAHFGFRLLPFENVPDPLFFFNQGQYNEVLKILMDSVAAGRGLTVLAGPIGSGKTTLSKQFAGYLIKTTKIIWLAEPPDSFDDLVLFIGEEIGIETKKKSRLFLLRDIRARLLAIRRKGLRCLLIVDESHRMTKGVLEGIRILTNLEEGSAKLLQILLLGQEELVENLNLDEMKALKQRISTLRSLDRLDPDKARHYILHRLRLGGGKPDVFSDHALNMISLFAGGIPRVINSFCHHSLRVAYESEKKTVEPEHVHNAAQELALAKETFHYLLRLRQSTESGFSSSTPVSAQESQKPKSAKDGAAQDSPNLIPGVLNTESLSPQTPEAMWPALVLLLLSILSLLSSTWYYMWKSGFWPST